MGYKIETLRDSNDVFGFGETDVDPISAATFCVGARIAEIQEWICEGTRLVRNAKHIDVPSFFAVGLGHYYSERTSFAAAYTAALCAWATLHPDEYERLAAWCAHSIEYFARTTAEIEAARAVTPLGRRLAELRAADTAQKERDRSW